MVMFADRVDAGMRLAMELDSLRGEDPVVLGLPRGGVPVAYQVAQHLGAPLDVIVVRKLGIPFQPEVAMGAIGEDGASVLDRRVMQMAGVTDEELSAVTAREQQALHDRVTRLRSGRNRVPLEGRVAIIVDDGIATGSTARVACHVARRLGASKIVLAVPVGPASALRDIEEADEVVCVATPEPFVAVGLHYQDFSPTSDEEVVRLLDLAAKGSSIKGGSDGTSAPGLDVEIPIGVLVLGGHLHLPAPGSGIVVFAHGSGSSRYSPRNRYVASVLNDAGLGTLLLDLLTPAEESDRSLVFDVEFLAGRLNAATAWLRSRPDTASAPIGYFGASTGAGAALWAAAEPDADIAAVVSRGGRPDLAGPRLAGVRAPTLFIVGSRDETVLALNREAQSRLRCDSELVVIEGATHLFEEPGTLAAASLQARTWFTRHLSTSTIDAASGESTDHG